MLARITAGAILTVDGLTLSKGSLPMSTTRIEATLAHIASKQPARSIEAIVSEVAVATCETLGIEPARLTGERAGEVMAKSNVQTTTELLALLALFHRDVDDTVGAQLLADFTARFAEHEATVV